MTSITLVIVTLLGLTAHASARSVLKKPAYPFKFYDRDDWRALPATDVRLLSLPVQYVVIHHTYIPAACHSFEDCAAKMRSMQTYHNSLDWGDIGYNFCVGSEGGVYEGRGWDNRGIHAGRANRYSIGICLIGDWRVELPSKDQLDSTKALIAEGVKQGKISPDYKLIGHDQAMQTECPGGALSSEISTWAHFSPGKHEFNNISISSTTVTPTVLSIN